MSSVLNYESIGPFHIFRLRTAENAHPQMRQVMRPLLAEVKRHLPALFGDL